MERKAIMLCVSVILIISTIINANAIQDEGQKIIEIPTLEQIKNMDLTEPCGLTVEQLERGLLYELKQYAKTYIEQEKTNVNAVFKAAQDALESGWGRHCFEKNNMSGFFTNKEFESKEECIWFVSSILKTSYLTEHDDHNCNNPYCSSGFYHNGCRVGLYYHGNTVYAISTRYCPTDGVNPNEDYSEAVCKIMLQIYSRALSVEDL